nr:hypothetical protein [Streptomyces lavendulae]
MLNVTVARIAAPAIRTDLGAGAGAVQLILGGYALTPSRPAAVSA